MNTSILERPRVPGPTTGGPAIAGGVRLDVRGVDKRYGERTVLRDARIAIEPGQFVAIVGRSGCGKSTLLRLVAGLEPVSGGTLQADGRTIDGLHDDTRIMFQEARLLPWRRVLDNVVLGLPATARERGREVLAQVGLAEREHEWPARLSGGQRQRVALARALVHHPRLLLLDEPLEGLAPIIVEELLRAIRRVAREEGLSSIVVEQHPHMVLGVTDDAIVLDRGAIAYRANSADLLKDPAPLDTWLGVAAHH
jgi:sulfonate transport system ATP-binding protein